MDCNDNCNSSLGEDRGVTAHIRPTNPGTIQNGIFQVRHTVTEINGEITVTTHHVHEGRTTLDEDIAAAKLALQDLSDEELAVVLEKIQLVHSNTVPSRPSLGALVSTAEWLPLDMRNKIKAMAADYDHEIREFHQRGEYKKARWNKTLAWSYACWYVLRGPVDAARDWISASLKGN